MQTPAERTAIDSANQTEEYDLETQFVKQIQHAVAPSRFDARDPWPVTSGAYTTCKLTSITILCFRLKFTGKILSQGTFLTIKTATVKDGAMLSASGGAELNSCIIKSTNFGQFYTLVAAEKNAFKRRLHAHSKAPQDRLDRMLQRTAMELLILNR